jgi:2-polyprenyl-3-methyl-5-hydroxy-6-metoxy-1,4-benzoquinol methylase
MIIPTSLIERSSLSGSDYGHVFMWQGRLFRGFHKENIDEVLKLVNSDFLKELIQKKFFIKTWISELTFETFDIVLEHQLIEVVTYPREWSFNMLKDSAKLVLDINETAQKYGFKTIDCHPYNVLFNNSRPIYVDFGSFKKTDIVDFVLAPYHEFMKSYYYPLKIWSLIGPYFGRSSVARTAASLPINGYIKIFYPFVRRIDGSLIDKFFQFLHCLKTIKYRDLSKLNKNKLKKLLTFISNLDLIYYIISRSAKIKYLKKKISKIIPLSEKSYWSHYNIKNIENVSRFSEIKKRLLQLNVKTVLEVGGNKGYFSKMISRYNFERIICTDFDAAAIDAGYQDAQKENACINWAVLNPFGSEDDFSEISTIERLRSEVVIALALTHHIILTESFSIAKTLRTLSMYTSNYIMVEFMPLGLYNGKTAPPLPSWYNLENFSKEFSKLFKIIEICQLEENRILLIGSKC